MHELTCIAFNDLQREAETLADVRSAAAAYHPVPESKGSESRALGAPGARLWALGSRL
jgi:hypothetical protein